MNPEEKAAGLRRRHSALCMSLECAPAGRPQALVCWRGLWQVGTLASANTLCACGAGFYCLYSASPLSLLLSSSRAVVPSLAHTMVHLENGNSWSVLWASRWLAPGDRGAQHPPGHTLARAADPTRLAAPGAWDRPMGVAQGAPHRPGDSGVGTHLGPLCS